MRRTPRLGMKNGRYAPKAKPKAKPNAKATAKARLQNNQGKAKPKAKATAKARLQNNQGKMPAAARLQEAPDHLEWRALREAEAAAEARAQQKLELAETRAAAAEVGAQELHGRAQALERELAVAEVRKTAAEARAVEARILAGDLPALREHSNELEKELAVAETKAAAAESLAQDLPGLRERTQELERELAAARGEASEAEVRARVTEASSHQLSTNGQEWRTQSQWLLNRTKELEDSRAAEAAKRAEEAASRGRVEGVVIAQGHVLRSLQRNAPDAGEPFSRVPLSLPLNMGNMARAPMTPRSLCSLGLPQH